MAATIRDVVALTGLSLGTVSKYINGMPVKESNRVRIEEAIQQLQFRPNNIAKGLRNSQTFLVAVLVPMLTSSFCTSMISSIETYLLPRGYSVVVCECHNSAEMELKKTQFLLNRMVDGIVLIPFGLDGKQIDLIQSNHTPLVLIDQTIKDKETDAIVLDNVQAGFIPTHHLLELGHEKIAIITGNKEHFTTRGRLNGYQKAMQAAGMSIEANFVQCGDYTIDGGYAAMLRLFALESKPTAVFISNYDMTMGAFLACNYLKLKIPKEVSVIGFDNFPLSNVTNPSLSFVEQPTDSMGLSAAQLLYRRIQGDYSEYPKVMVHQPVMFYNKSIRANKKTEC